MLLKVESAQPEKQLFIEMTSSITTGNVLPMVEEPRYADFARRLKEAMACKQLTVTDVKSELKITYEMARRYTLGIAMPREERMRKLADFVGRTAAYLQFGDETHENPSPPSPAAGQTGGEIGDSAPKPKPGEEGYIVSAKYNEAPESVKNTIDDLLSLPADQAEEIAATIQKLKGIYGSGGKA